MSSSKTFQNEEQAASAVSKCDLNIAVQYENSMRLAAFFNSQVERMNSIEVSRTKCGIWIGQNAMRIHWPSCITIHIMLKITQRASKAISNRYSRNIQRNNSKISYSETSENLLIRSLCCMTVRFSKKEDSGLPSSSHIFWDVVKSKSKSTLKMMFQLSNVTKHDR